MSRKRRTAADEPFLVVRTSMADLNDGGLIAAHRHGWRQLIHVSSGLAVVRTAAGSWIAPPSWAVWVPDRVEHAIRFVGPSALRTLYVRPDWRDDLPAGCCAFAVSPLLRELILRTTQIGMLDRRAPAEAAMAELIVGEIGEDGPQPFNLPEPTTDATLRAARLAVGKGASHVGVGQIARAVGLAPRSLERRFLAETGMTFGRWRQQSLLLKGLERAAGGASVKSAAEAAGYASPSAYVAAFRKAFGATPGRYF